MIIPELQTYIRQQLGAGIAKDVIKQALSVKGWSEQDMNDAFSMIENPQPQPQLPTAPPTVAQPPVQTPAQVPAQTPVQSPVQNLIQPTTVIPSSHKGVWAVVIVILLLICAGGAYAAYNYGFFSSPLATTTATTTPPSVASTTPDQYDLFVLNPTVGPNDVKLSDFISYVDEGVIVSGIYSGYHRIKAYVSSFSPDPDYVFVFVTKDQQTFIVNASSTDYANGPQRDTEVLFNKAKVVGFADIPEASIPIDSPPDTISLGNFILAFGHYYNSAPGENPTGSSLSSLVTGLSFYENPTPINATDTTRYYSGENDVLAKTSTGPLFDYALLSQEEFNTATDSPNGIFYTRSQISSKVPLYKTYGTLSPGACGGAPLTTFVLKNISKDDLAQIGTTLRGVALYTLKDPNHQLNQNEFNSKDGTPPYAEYVAKNPVLIFQDPWGRWTALGEYDYKTPGGCGKPVIYLYPPKPTEVTVKFTTPMRLVTDIPIYTGKGWDVMAHPDGELTDLQPALTNCDSIDPTVSGSEYAQIACKRNDYPYLYWAGQASEQYPVPTGGWIVPREDVPGFLKEKLKQIGLTDKERNDMMEYWIPELFSKNAPYYRLSFFQTEQMNQFIPMQVTPRSDTVIRVFLDWSPLSALPATLPQPQILNHIDRNGFTLVEWGGLKI